MKYSPALKSTIFIFTLCAAGVFASAQSFDQLISRAYAGLDSGAYLQSARSFEKAFGLLKNEAVIRNHFYNAACAFSLANHLPEAHYYLDQSFASHEKIGSRPVSIAHLLSDPDLTNYRRNENFKKLVGKYYAQAEAKYILEKELLLIDLIDFLNLQLKKGNSVTISDKIIYEMKKDGKYLRASEFDVLWSFNSDVNSNIRFENCDFHLSLVWGDPKRIAQYNSLIFKNCNFFYDLNFQSLETVNPPQFIRCSFMQRLNAVINVSSSKFSWTSADLTFLMDSCIIGNSALKINSASPMDVRIINNIMTDSASFGIMLNSAGTVSFNGNSFGKGNVYLNITTANGIQITNTTISNLILENTSISSILNIDNSTLGGRFLFRNSFFPDIPTSNVDWDQVRSRKLGVLKGIYPFFDNKVSVQYIDGQQEAHIKNDVEFRELMGVYSMFLNLYKSKSDMESYNRSYIAIKELQSERLKLLYRQNRTFESFFRWQLSRLLRFYVRYGTDPARAIVISLYIIFAFGVFFFFFPSDWDRTSKITLIENYKIFIEKNDKGYVRPFFVLLAGFGVSLLNALTLSLNAFITLGFGNIPTHGIARYFCVLEGFLGWFLLSIFTVALINQVL